MKWKCTYVLFLPNVVTLMDVVSYILSVSKPTPTVSERKKSFHQRTISIFNMEQEKSYICPARKKTKKNIHENKTSNTLQDQTKTDGIKYKMILLTKHFLLFRFSYDVP